MYKNQKDSDNNIDDELLHSSENMIFFSESNNDADYQFYGSARFWLTEKLQIGPKKQSCSFLSLSNVSGVIEIIKISSLLESNEEILVLILF